MKVLFILVIIDISEAFLYYFLNIKKEYKKAALKSIWKPALINIAFSVLSTLAILSVHEDYHKIGYLLLYIPMWIIISIPFYGIWGILTDYVKYHITFQNTK